MIVAMAEGVGEQSLVLDAPYIIQGALGEQKTIQYVFQTSTGEQQQYILQPGIVTAPAPGTRQMLVTEGQIENTASTSPPPPNIVEYEAYQVRNH